MRAQPAWARIVDVDDVAGDIVFRPRYARTIVLVNVPLAALFTVMGVVNITGSGRSAAFGIAQLVLATLGLVAIPVWRRGYLRLGEHALTLARFRPIVVPYDDIVEVHTDTESVRWSTRITLLLRSGEMQDVVSEDLPMVHDLLTRRLADHRSSAT